MAEARIGLVGLGVMGANLALNIADNGFPVVVHNRTTSVIDDFIANAGDLADRLVPAQDYAQMAAALTPPRAIIIMVKAGGPVDAVIDELKPHLDKGDIIIDAGNADFNDTRRREADLKDEGYRFVGMGVSGGEEGARHGPSIMVGGAPEAYAELSEIVEAIAAKYQDVPCAAHMGPDGAGHFVKTVHNGIEYADMQMIAEIYGILRDGDGRSPEAIGEIFHEWNQGPLQSYLVEITAEVLRATDPETGSPMVDIIQDMAGQKGTGRWTVIEALKLGQSPSTIEAAVAARSWSAGKPLRETAEGLLKELPGAETALPLLEGDLERALLAARIIGYSQGFSLLRAASDEFDWNLDLSSAAEIWRAGCIIRSSLLDDIATAFREDLPGDTLVLAPSFVRMLNDAIPALRRVVSQSAINGLAVPALSSALAYYDTLRKGRGTAALIQGQRDFFGAHGFERTDKDGTDYHGPWGQ
ncbi:NADP-dependent phosphogluconate dehydrogenase [Psychromarinibacter halotolerans]|uniref:6-phosphogluconate dehydrogenase, decarboxylating n=1 Tax=Psychromarinibacter halotolerans TaxID=1775175 RepID=A0ABV7GLQ9_9RHOB|nr:NADP-dependent phosphogluconate dehydrogenase [Psychromarinibacter halotolerans]MAQ86397.1 phosphogluconate dehydrogenase (NADP(+)-dependent, decarboxylating) [Maritimibacter sp.]MDF0597124.1 NADP-dependent phosphogluconate dehydrogenase [Psychromarinibacter halotolerans]